MKTGIDQSKYRNLTLFHVVWSVPGKVFLTVTFSFYVYTLYRIDFRTVRTAATGTSQYFSGELGREGLVLNPHSWTFTSVIVGSSPLSHLFTSATVRTVPLHTIFKCDTQPIRYVTLHMARSAWGSFASLQKSRQNHRSYAMWTVDALSGMIFVPVQKLSCIVWTWP